MSHCAAYYSAWYRRRKVENPAAHAAWIARNSRPRKPRQEHPLKAKILLLLRLSYTYSEIAFGLGTTRCVVAGIAYRARKKRPA